MPATSQADAPQARKADTDREELRRELTSTATLMLMAVSAFASWQLLRAPYFLSGPSLIALGLFGVALLAHFLGPRLPTLSRGLILVGPSLCLGAALKVVGSPGVPYLACLIVTLNAAVDPNLGLAAAILNTAVLLALVPRGSALYPPLTLLWLITGTQLISSRGLYTVLGWAWNSQEQASGLVTELRRRQGQLNQTLAALTEASRRLEHINRELTIARQDAEEARALKEQFVANVSHELRTPLNLILGFAEMMYLNPESYHGVVWTPELDSDIGEIYLASQHLQGLVNDVLDLSRIDAAHLPMFRELADVREIAAEALETVAPLLRQRKLSYELQSSSELPLLFVDRTRIRQVMLNLLNNAARFTDTGGITVSIDRVEDAVVVSVRDTGMGIPQDQLEAIFEEFRQVGGGPRGRGGAGLGLAISRQFVMLHGGRIWAESGESDGSTLRFSLPLPGSLPITTKLERTPDRERVDWSAAPVVVVDADPSIAEMLGRHLDRQAIAAGSLAEAEQLVEDLHAVAVVINQPPDAAGETWVGPGSDLCERYSVPVVRCSIPSPSWLQRAAGLDGCLTKPVTREALSQELKKHCREPATILVVDDNPGFVSLMVRILEGMPLAATVLTAYSGAEALRTVRERGPGLVLLDLLMPDMDGFAVLDALRSDAALRDTAVVAVTATSYAEEALQRRGSCVTLSQSRGIPAGSQVELLRSILKVVHPDYLDSTALSA